MTAIDYSIHAIVPNIAVPNLTAPVTPGAAATNGAAASSDSDDSFTFHDLLDVVNPLQHLPIVSTLYRHFTGEQIKTLPKIAGDALYGGWMGFASSVADTVFEKVTGKSFGETALAMVEDVVSPSSPTNPATAVADASASEPVTAMSAPVKPVQIADLAPIDTTATPVASNAPALPAPVMPASLDSFVIPGQDALFAALSRNGVGQDTALRAVDAYRRTVGVANAAANAALPQPALRASYLQ